MKHLLAVLVVLGVVYVIPDYSPVRESRVPSTYEQFSQDMRDREYRDHYRHQQPVIVQQPQHNRVICVRNGDYINCFYR